MILDMSALTSAGEVLAVGSDGDASDFGLLFLLSGFVFYALMFLRYRNIDKRHRHESETRASLHDVRASDTFHRSLKGVSNRRMDGANNEEVRGAHSSALDALPIKLPKLPGL